MTIQWFPGHMLETEKLLKNAAAKVDVILEILDARLPDASGNPLVDKLCRQNVRFKLLNKSDLADPDVTAQWIDYFSSETNSQAIAISATDKTEAGNALNFCASQIKRNRARKLKVMVVGIPNTGKSTFLNTLAGKKVAKTGNVPAVTRHQQRTSLKNNIDMYDTPGILWPVIEPLERAYALAVSGAISDTAVDYHDIAYFAAGLLLKKYPDQLKARYPFMEPPAIDGNTLIEGIGIARGCLKKGGRINYQKASEILIRDLRSGRLGRISFETPNDLETTHETET